MFGRHGPTGGCGHGGCSDGFVAKLTADGSALVYGSYLGGGNVGDSFGSAIAVDGAGNAYVTGFFSPPSMPVQYHFDPSRGYTAGAFVLKFGPTGDLVYSSDFGSGTGAGIAVDAAGHVYLTGFVVSGSTFPIVNAMQVTRSTWRRFTFPANQQLNFAVGWDVPATAQAGTYRIAVAIFNIDRSLVYASNAQAGTFTVGAVPSPGLIFTIGAGTVTPNPVPQGGSVRIDVAVTSNGAASGIILDLELYAAGGGRVLQNVLGGQSFTAGQARTFSWTINPVNLAVGTYTLKVGIFNGDWSTLYTWDNDAGLVTVR